MAVRERHYWVVSPNVKNNNHTVEEWRHASLTRRAAFMGWAPDDQGRGEMGRKFAGRVSGGVEPGDVVLIARRHNHVPEVVGFGVVEGEARTALRGFKPPDDFGSLRTLRPFVPWSGSEAKVDVRTAVGHTRALVQLHPHVNESHRAICDWMERHLQKASMPHAPEMHLSRKTASRRRSGQLDDRDTRDVAIVALPGNFQLDYEVRSKDEVRRAQRQEAILLENYQQWLKNQDRELGSVKIGALQCDGYDRLRGNLIEAKASARREHIRMAVGQLLDYAFQGKSELQKSRLAILLPEKPSKDIEDWLDSLDIKLIWSAGTVFLDNANGRFT